VSTKQNFDSLLFPANHVARRPTDTYYFDPHHVLRTHTTAHQVELLQQGHEAFLVTGDVYRRDEIDARHYPIFHQMDGVRVFRRSQHKGDPVTFESAVLEELKADLEGVGRALFGPQAQMRWIDAYFPFTEPSLELEVYFNDKWMEVLGCGLIHTNIMKNAGFHDTREHVGYAFGLGLERLAMVLFDVPDIRLFWSQDTRFLSQFKSGRITKFTPYSKYPACYKDISFWLPSSTEEQAEWTDNDFYELVRDEAGDLVESVEIVDEFTHPKTQRKSKCFRIMFRSMDRSLTNEEIDVIQFRIRDLVTQKLKVQLR
jgi:phenylalanyl-tRNA synthetase alpha chain